MSQTTKLPAIKLTLTALFMAMNIAFSSFGIPVPGGHIYLCDAVICLSAILLGPFEAFIVGGIGSFLGDILFYPLPMFVSLFTHGLQAMTISFISHNTFKYHPRLASALGVAIGSVIMVTGYTLGKAFIYSTPAYAIMGIPYEALQATVGAFLGMILCWKLGVYKYYISTINSNAVYRQNLELEDTSWKTK